MNKAICLYTNCKTGKAEKSYEESNCNTINEYSLIWPGLTAKSHLKKTKAGECLIWIVKKT